MTKQSNINREEVEYIAKLARIELSESEIEHFSKQLDKILAYIDKLKEVDVEGVEPTSHIMQVKNVYREDKLCPSLAVERVLENAPEREGEFFKVPKVI